MTAATGRDTRTQLVRGLGLARRTDLVALGLDRHQGGVDRRRLDRSAAPLHTLEGYVVILEDDACRVEVELLGDVEHGEVLGVELLGAPGGLGVVREIGEQASEGSNVTLGVEANERCRLQEPRVNPPAMPGERP